GRKRRKWRSGVFVVEGDINDLPLLKKLFELVPFTHVMHLAAQAGVRYAKDNPSSYVHKQHRRKPAKRLLTLATTSTASPSPPSGFSPSTALGEDLTWLISSSPEAPLFPSSKAEKSTGSGVSDLASILERLLKVKAKRNMMKLPRNGDVQFTHANISWAQRELPPRICILVSRSLLDGILVTTTTTGAKRKLPLDLLGLSLNSY
ncbi:hypothetical protein DY000_02044138, partial [Brassica cretica]